MVVPPELHPDQRPWIEWKLKDGARLRFECAYPLDAGSKDMWSISMGSGFRYEPFVDVDECLRSGRHARVPHGFYVTLFDADGKAVKTW